MTQSTQPVAAAQVAGTDEPNPYLLGVYAPVDTEIDASDLRVIGQIPTDLNGVYLRNGHNQVHALTWPHAMAAVETCAGSKVSPATSCIWPIPTKLETKSSWTEPSRQTPCPI